MLSSPNTHHAIGTSGIGKNTIPTAHHFERFNVLVLLTVAAMLGNVSTPQPTILIMPESTVYKGLHRVGI